VPMSPRTAAPRRREYVLGALLVVAVLALGGVIVRLFTLPAPASIVRFEILPPENAAVAPDVLQLSPDGHKVAFIADQRIWIRPIDSTVAQPLPATQGAFGLVWSPDSQYLAFPTLGRLQKVAASGGPAQVLCSIAGNPQGFS